MHSPTPLKLDSLIPASAGLGWQLNLFDISTVVSEHYHKLQTQLIMMLEGAAKFHIGPHEIDLFAGQMLILPAQVEHSIYPQNRACFFALDLPGFAFPEDAYFEKAPLQDHVPMPFVSSKSSVDQHTQIAHQYLNQFKIPTELPANLYQKKIELQGYTVYELPIPAANPQWSLALIDVMEAPKHFHKHGFEHFLVVSGELDIELDGERYVLVPGQSVHIAPNQHHHLRSNIDTPVRVLCVNFPAFDPEDYFLAEI